VDGVEHVGVALAVGDHEQVLGVHAVSFGQRCERRNEYWFRIAARRWL
jgi:hypothetical protein